MNGNRYRSVVFAALAALVAAVGPVRAAAPAASTEVVAVRLAALPSAPDDAAWREAPVFAAALIPQDMVEPRLMNPSTPAVNVRAVTDGARIVFRLDWADAVKDDVQGVARFADACAVQLPAKTQPDVPAPQMGEPGKPVEITFWRAAWQATVDGREDSIKAIYPNATVDHYPFEAASLAPKSEAQQEMAKRYAPARGLENAMAGPRKEPLQDLVAEGPGTLRPAAQSQSTGRGVLTADGWTVVMSRPLPKGLEPGVRTQVAFAVWQGEQQEAGARKMRSVWVPLLFEAKK